MAATQIILSLVKLFLMIIPGFILSKKGIIDEHQSKGISSIIINLTWPCLIIMSLQREFSRELCINMGILALVMVADILAAFVVAKAISKGLKVEKSLTYLMIFMLMFGNTGFMGIPVCTVLYGGEGTFYAALIDCVQDIFIFTAGLVMIEKSTGSHIGLSIRHFMTPGFASIVIGLGLFVGGITLPEIISGPLEVIGSATSPLAMLVVGYQLGSVSFREMFSDLRLYVLSIAKTIIMPLIFMLLLLLIFSEPGVLVKTLIIEMAAPVAACTTIYSQKYGGDVEFATKGVMLSTLISIVTLSAFAVIVEMAV
ncbi:MAG: AEC family transporter [Clostridia bacterium]|nr:AEC family transporter [Clostridia bacterium]